MSHIVTYSLFMDTFSLFLDKLEANTCNYLLLFPAISYILRHVIV